MSKIKTDLNLPTNINVTHNIDHIEKKLEEYSHLLSEDEIAKAKLAIHNKRLLALSPNIDDVLYSSFMIGKSLTEISEQHGYPLDVVVMTALHFNWWKRKGRDSKEAEVGGIETIALNIAETSLLIIKSAISKQLQEISKGTDDPRESVELVSAAMKEMKSVTGFLGSMKQSDRLMNASSPQKPMVQISNQTLNVAGNQQAKTEVIDNQKKALPETSEDRIKDLEEIENLS